MFSEGLLFGSAFEFQRSQGFFEKFVHKFQVLESDLLLELDMIVVVSFLEHDLLIFREPHVRQLELSSLENELQYFPADRFKISDVLVDIREHFEGEVDQESLAFHQVVLVFVVEHENRLLTCLFQDIHLLFEHFVDFADNFLDMGELTSALDSIINLYDLFLDLNIDFVKFSYFRAFIACEVGENRCTGEDAVFGSNARLHLPLMGLHSEFKV